MDFIADRERGGENYVIVLLVAISPSISPCLTFAGRFTIGYGSCDQVEDAADETDEGRE